MGYIPEGAKWYIAELIMECRINGEPRNIVHVNIILVRADSPQEAFQKPNNLIHLSKINKNPQLLNTIKL